MPIKMFHANGDQAIAALDQEVNQWLEKLDRTHKVKQIHTAISESNESGPTFVLTVWYAGLLDSN